MDRFESVAQDVVIHGTLVCSHQSCQAITPVIDGVAMLMPDPAAFLACAPGLLEREDLPERLQILVHEAAGPGSSHDLARQQISQSVWDHWGEWDAGDAHAMQEIRPGAIARVLHTMISAAGGLPEGPRLEIGAAAGRGTAELARGADELVLGVDLHAPILRVASKVLRTGEVEYRRRRVGLVYDMRRFDLPAELAPSLARCDLWACDALALPFADETFGVVVALNVLDAIASPILMLREAARVLRPGGVLLMACPYDWAASATPVEGWVGGHSPWSVGAGESPAVLRDLLTPGAHAQSIGGLSVVAEVEHIPWHVRLHERSHVAYTLHGVVARKHAAPE
jgi:SAM-dependent methyltransferase